MIWFEIKCTYCPGLSYIILNSHVIYAIYMPYRLIVRIQFIFYKHLLGTRQATDACPRWRCCDWLVSVDFDRYWPIAALMFGIVVLVCFAPYWFSSSHYSSYATYLYYNTMRFPVLSLWHLQCAKRAAPPGAAFRFQFKESFTRPQLTLWYYFISYCTIHTFALTYRFTLTPRYNY